MRAARELFDRICELPEYYPTRTELAILTRHAGEIARQMGPRAEIVEFGAGSLRKVRLLLDAMERPRAICRSTFPASTWRVGRRAAARLSRPGRTAGDRRLHAAPVVAVLAGGQGAGSVFFPGSTIGNFAPGEALHFLQRARRRCCAAVRCCSGSTW